MFSNQNGFASAMQDDVNLSGKQNYSEKLLNINLPQMKPIQDDAQQLQLDFYPSYDKQKNYYQEFWRVYLQNEILISQMKDSVIEVQNLKNEFQRKQDDVYSLEKSMDSQQKNPQKKKFRRIDAEIEKTFQCPYSNCGKHYASEVSLNLHIKIKHKGGNKTEREKFARTLIEAESTGKKVEIPEDLNLPPGYLECFRSQEKKKTNEEKANGCSKQNKESKTDP